MHSDASVSSVAPSNNSTSLAACTSASISSPGLQIPNTPTEASTPSDVATTPGLGVRRGNWPVRYQLPILTKPVLDALNRKDLAFIDDSRSGLRNQLIQTLFEDVNMYTWYPSSQQYTDVIAALCSKYPYLCDVRTTTTNSTHSTTSQTLLLSLRNKFKKERKPLTDLEVVKQHKMKFGAHGRGRKRKDDEVTDDNVSATAAKQIRVGQPVLLDAGEDNASIEQHLAVMAAEIDRADRVHLSAEILLDRQKRTLAARTEDLQNLTTIEILVKYPWISLPKLLLAEMRLRFGVEVNKEIRQALGHIAEKIVDKVASNKKSDLEAALLAAFVRAEEGENARKEMALNVSALFLPRLFKTDKIEFLYTYKQPPPCKTPTILFSKVVDSAKNMPPCRIVLDEVEVMQEEAGLDCVSILACLMSAYYVYNIQYPAQISNTLKFIQHHLLHLDEEASPANVRRVATLLQK